MDRRSFLTQFGAISTTAAVRAALPLGQEPPAGETVEKIHVIFKTHLDIGFTQMAANVLETYFDHFIPGVLSLSEQIKREHMQDRYIWTTGSWLIYRYLEVASAENRRRMEHAIQAGDFVWHGLPFTTHTELMDESLFGLATTFSARLDQRFQRKTIAAKMTDVPGHCRGMVPAMARAGLELLHIGVNSASMPPDVPPLFVWKSPDGSELTVMYQKDYGGVMVLPGGRTAVAVSFTNDNHGPHTLQQVAQIYGQLRRQFPNARVFASDLNAVATEVRSMRHRLPVVTQELGDTWIHGPGSDPLLMAQFRELSRLRREWLAQTRLSANGDADAAFGKHFLRVAEHTWGLDVKTFLKHWDAYSMDAFRASRNLPEFKRMEESWAEKRACIGDAVGSLPPELAAEANARLKALRPLRTDRREFRRLESPAGLHDTKHFRIGFDPKTGAIRFLEHRESGRQWAGPAHALGLFSYQTFSQPDFERFQRQYLTQRPDWAVDDFGKRGLERSGAKSALYVPALKDLWSEDRKDGQLFVADLEVPEARELGCPREITIETFLPANEPTVKLVLKWFNKPACRLPEALWLSFVPRISGDGQFEMDKMGQPVSPLDVVRNGNRHLHGVIDGVAYKDARSSCRLETRDAFLAAPGKPSLLTFDNQQPDMAGGMHFCLCNNVWGTNFTMWFGEDMQFRFAMKFDGRRSS
jgi:hypothetical protein